jgi:peptidoglycan/LPS O-acetylase OafA/YrhL
VQELGLYGVFWGFGLASTRVKARFGGVTVATRAAIAAVVAAAATAWMILRPPPLGIVNASPMAELLFGVAWIIGLTAVAGPIERVAARRALRRVVDVLNRRSMSTYLWHCGAIALSLAALGPARNGAPRVGGARLVVTAPSPSPARRDLTAPPPRRLHARAVVGVCRPRLSTTAVLPVAQLENAEAVTSRLGRG